MPISGERRRRPFWHLARRRSTVASEVDEELAGHLEMTGEALVRQGMAPDEARREARRRFGNVDEARRYCRAQDERKESRVQLALMSIELVEDARIAVRSLVRVPFLALAVLATVGVGIGATTAIFSAVDAALLRPLPYAQPDRLVRIYTDAPPFRFRFSAADYFALQAQQTSFEQTATYTGRTMTYADRDAAALVTGRAVSWSYFRTLGIAPARGRGFTEADGRPGSQRVVVVSHGFWQSRLGGRTDAIGRMLRLDGADYELAGVLPARVGPLEQGQEFFVVQQFAPPPRRGPFLYTVVARLRPGVSLAAAASELRAINRRIFPIWKSSYQDDKATWSAVDLKRHVAGDVGATAGLALAAVVLVWLIACANASNLLIARVTGRKEELALRAALGASRGRVVRFLLAESAVLVLGSVAVGAGIAKAGTTLLRSIGAGYFPRMNEIAFGAPEAWLLAGLAGASALIFGLVPALHGSGSSSRGSLSAPGRTSTGSTGARRLRQVLVGAQFAVATPLLIVAALLLASLDAVGRVDVGFDTQGIVTGAIRLPSAQYSDQARVRSTWDEMLRRVAALPGVVGAAWADGRPPNGVDNLNNFDLEDVPTPPGQSQPVTPWVAVTPGYFGVLGLPLLEGRLLDERDALPENLEAVVVDRAWARRFFPGKSAVGRRFREGGCTACPWTTVVGVVSEVKYAGLDKPDQGTVYWPLVGSLSRFLVVRTHGDPGVVLSAIPRAIRELEPGAPLTSAATIDDLVAQSLDGPRSLSVLVAAFALVALLLSVVGIYGVMTYYVQQHLKEISIRVALGGTRRDVLRLVVGQGMMVVALGVAVGAAASLGLTRLVATLLFGIGAADPVAYAGVGALLLGAALAACLAPAWRAVGVQPAALLRQE